MLLGFEVRREGVGGQLPKDVMQKFFRGFLWTEKRGQINKKCRMVSSAPQVHRLLSAAPIRWRKVFSLEWPHRIWISWCGAEVDLSILAEGMVGKNIFVTWDVSVSALHSVFHLSQKKLLSCSLAVDQEVLTSSGSSLLEAAAFAALSAISFPSIPSCPLTHV